VWAIAKIMVRALFPAGHDTVVVDATNVSRKRRDEWKSRDWVRVFEVVPTDAATCRARAEAMNDAEILPVIDRMAAEWEPVGPDELAEYEDACLAATAAPGSAGKGGDRG
jgi:hypothetical protein